MRKLLALLLALVMVLSMSALAEISSLLPYDGDVIEIEVYMGYTSADDTKPIFEYIQKAIGNVKFNFEITSTEDRETKRNLYLSTGKIPDIMLCQGLEQIKTNYFADGEDMFLNLKDYEEYMPNWKANREADPSQLWFDVDEETAYFVLPVVPNRASEGWFANKTRLDEYNLEVPTTFDEFIHCMEVIETANPEKTQLAGYTCWGVDYWRILASNLIGDACREASGYYIDEETGKYYLFAQTEMFKKSVELLTDWYQKGYFYPDDFNMSEEEMISKVWAQNDWTFACTYQDSPENFLNKWAGELPIEIVPMMPPAIEGVTPVIKADYRNDGYYWAYCASAETEHPEIVASILDYLVSTEYATLYSWGVEDLTFAVDENGKKAYIGEFTDAQARVDFGIQKTLFDDSIARQDMDGKAAAYPERLVDAFIATSTWLNSGEATNYYYQQPQFTDDEAEDFNVYYNPYNTYITENLAKFVYGEKDLSEFDEFIAGIPNYCNVEKMLAIADNAEQRVYASAEERDFWVPAK